MNPTRPTDPWTVILVVIAAAVALVVTFYVLANFYVATMVPVSFNGTVVNP